VKENSRKGEREAKDCVGKKWRKEVVGKEGNKKERPKDTCH
jgi:hypothetical protein